MFRNEGGERPRPLTKSKPKRLIDDVILLHGDLLFELAVQRIAEEDQRIYKYDVVDVTRSLD